MTMQTETTKTTTSSDTARTLEQREAEEQRGREALTALETERTEAATAFAGDMSLAKRTKVETLDGKVSDARLTLEALETRTRAARRVHESTVQAEKRATLRELVRRADPDRLRRTLFDRLVEPVINLDRAFAAAIEQSRLDCRDQRAIVASARELAEELGEVLAVDEVFVDELRVAAGVGVARARIDGEREGTGVEEFFTPIAKPGERADHEQFERAVALLETMKGTAR